MANENSLRSYRDFDAYNRDAHTADLEPRRGGGDPLAELARIMGQDQGYADLLKSVARTRDELPSADELHHDDAGAGEIDIPAMDLRGAEPQAAEAEVDWDDLEAELQTYQQAEHTEAHDAYSADQDGAGELRGSYRDWDGRDEVTADLERLLADEFHTAPAGEAPAAEQARSRLGFGAAALGVVAAGGAAAMAWKSRAGRQAAGEAPPQAHAPGQAYAPGHDQAGGDAYAPYDPGYADEAAPPRRRSAGMTAVAAVLGLAVLGGGGVLTYRAVTGGASVGGEPRIVRANPEPVRVAVQQAQEPKPVTDRLPGGDRIVSREERPVSQREQAAQVQAPPAPSRIIPLVPAPAQAAPVGMVTDPGQAPVRTVNAVPVAAPAAAPSLASAPQPAPRVGEEPRRVRTVQVGPDGSILQPAAPAAPRTAPVAAAPVQPLSVVPSAAPASPSSPALAAAETRSAPTPASRPVQTVRVARAEPPQEPARPVVASRQPATATPLDLGPQRTATVRTAATGSGSTFVQISSHQSDAEARSAFASAQRRFPMLQGQSPNIRTAEIAGRGTWHRLRVGPFSREEAQGFCQRLRTAGGSCVLN
jgi:hypothetical protein